MSYFRINRTALERRPLYIHMEQWKEIEEFPQYEVSNHGRVRNANTRRILQTNFDEKGRERLILYKGNKQYSRKIHRLVADAFCDQYYEGLDVTHADGDVRNNHADNLEWRFRSDIARRSYKRHGRKQTHSMKRILCVETGVIYESIQQASEEMNMSRTVISRIINARSFCSKDGYHFVWVE